MNLMHVCQRSFVNIYAPNSRDCCNIYPVALSYRVYFSSIDISLVSHQLQDQLEHICIRQIDNAFDAMLVHSDIIFNTLYSK